jgi:tetratricopeptide (TPR) repeat protein
MSKYRLILISIAAMALGPSAPARGQFPGVQAEGFLAQNAAAGRSNEDRLYEQGQRALDSRRWEEAVQAFSEAAKENGPRADGALYWRAFALNKLGRRQEALAAIAQLSQSHAGSRWLDDAKALEIEMRQGSGQKVDPSAEPDEDLKLMALNGLMNSDPDRALPMLEKIVKGAQSPKLKERALFVLSQGDSPKAREILAQAARGVSNPDLQMKAINYLGVMCSTENSKLLAELYTSSNDPHVKRAVLRSFMVAGDRDHLLQAAKSEKSPELRMEAMNQLGVSGGQAELWQLYQSEPSVEVKEKILHSMFIGGESTRLMELARTEKDVRLRKAAIRSLGLMGEHSGPGLVSMYGSESDPDVRREILNGLFISGNAKALVELARKETDPKMKRAIVEKLSVMGSKEGTDYLMELLNK